MKTCPNCGKQLDADVKFCTNCGANVANLGASNSQVQAPNQQSAQPSQASQFTRQVGSQISNAVQNFDANSLWKWFVNSWKHPMGEQTSEKWYGAITFLVEDILFVIGLMISANREVNNSISSATQGYITGTNGRVESFTGGLAFSFILYLVFLTAGLILASYIGSKFVYGGRINFWYYTNQIAQIDNLSAIFVVVAFIAFLASGYAFGAFLAILAAIFFVLATIMPVVANEGAKRDKFYGLLICIVIEVIIFTVLTSIFGQNIEDQINSLSGNLFGSLLH